MGRVLVLLTATPFADLAFAGLAVARYGPWVGVNPLMGASSRAASAGWSPGRRRTSRSYSRRRRSTPDGSASGWRELFRIHTSNSVVDEWGLLCVATGLTPGEPEPEGTERIELRWVTLDEAIAMIDDGGITDAMTQVGLLRVALALATGDVTPRPASGPWSTSR